MLFTQIDGVLSSRLNDGTVQTVTADFGDLFVINETGLMGIVVDPDFTSNRRFYTCQGYIAADVPEIRVVAWTIDDTYTAATRVDNPLVGGILVLRNFGRHAGCRLRFGPDGYLWISTGDGSSWISNTDSLAGKTLRVDASTGEAAPDNPFGSRVYTYGHRNPQGLALRPGTREMWLVEHGPSTDDEVNKLVAGGNYGWNAVLGLMTDLEQFPDAIEAKWSSGYPTFATSGGVFLEGEQWGVWEGRLAVATLKYSRLILFEFTPSGDFVSQVVVPELASTFGRLRTPMMGPDGALYVTTSNGAGRADRILRLVAEGEPVMLKLTPGSIGENGGVSTVTATLDRAADATTTVTVSAEAVVPAVPGDFTLSANRTLTIAAGDVSSSGVVTIAAVNNDRDAPDKKVTVTATAENINGTMPLSAVMLTITDDDENRPPEAVGTLRPLSLVVDEGARSVDVSGAFADPDADPLTFGASSAAARVTTAAVSGSVATVTPLSAGESTVTVTATDVGGSNASATQRFVVSVTVGPDPPGGGGGGGGGGRNRPPEAVGTLADHAVEVGATPLLVDVSGAFQDRDDDPLTYAAESAAAEVAAVEVAASMVTVRPLATGTAVVTVTATDAEGSNRSATQAFTVTVAHDADGDGLIGIHTPAQLDAVRHDLDGDGSSTLAGAGAYAAAFGVTGAQTVSCAATAGCRGYELGADLDLDTNGSGGPDAGDAYWYDGAGWPPLGTATEPFTATFEGNRHRIRGLFVRRGDGAGLFGSTGSSSVVRHVGVIAVDVAGANAVGGLVALNAGLVTGSYATGRVSGTARVGGLVGTNAGVVGGSYATAQVTGETSTGGLVGVNDGSVAAGYATGRVSATARVGGLAGSNQGTLTAVYATGRVSGTAQAGGLVGATEPMGAVTAGYWDTDTSGRAASNPGAPAHPRGQGQPTSALQEPTEYAGLYAAWNVDGDGSVDDPWRFGTNGQYPALSLGADADARSTWQEMGRQLRTGPTVTVTPAADPVRVELTWTGSDTGAWTPPPAVSYTVYRESGGTLETRAAGVRGLRYVDRGMDSGTVYRYQVAAVVDGGEAVRSSLVTAAVPCAYAVRPLHRDVLWTAGTGEVRVTTGSGCTWTATSESAFLTVTGHSSGTGSGTVTYAVAPNAGGARTGSLLVAGHRVTVYQASPTAFTDHPLEPGLTPVRAIHFLELRARIDTLRAGASLPAFPWTDSTLIPGVTPIKGVHLTDLQRALAEASVAAGKPTPAWTDRVTTTLGNAIRAAHLMEVRAAVTALRWSDDEGIRRSRIISSPPPDRKPVASPVVRQFDFPNRARGVDGGLTREA